MGQVRHGSATFCYQAGDLQSKSADRDRTPSELQYSAPLAGRVLRSNVPRSASLARAAVPRTRDQPKDGGQVA